MSDDERTELAVLVAKQGAALEALVRQYEKNEERKEVSRVEDREDRRKWRDEMTQKIDALEVKIAPVVKHHEMAVTVTKFALKYGTPSGVLAGLAWIWNHLKDRP